MEVPHALDQLTHDQPSFLLSEYSVARLFKHFEVSTIASLRNYINPLVSLVLLYQLQHLAAPHLL